MKVVELFSGIGSQAKALKRAGIRHEVVRISEWDVNSIIAYDIIHNGAPDIEKYNHITKDEFIEVLASNNLSGNGKTPLSEKALHSMNYETLIRLYAAIKRTKNVPNVEYIQVADLPMVIDVMTYSFPCQDLSNMGAIHGYTNGINKNHLTRSGLLWQVERIIVERKNAKLGLPKFLVLENVPALTSKRNLADFNLWKNTLETLGYYNKAYKLNARNFGIPQNRERIVMISVLTNGISKPKLDSYFEKHNLESSEYLKSIAIKPWDLHELFNRTSNYEHEKRNSQPNDTLSRKTIWNRNPKLIDEDYSCASIVPTITTKQDRHPNSGVIYYPTTRNNFRYLTPRECFLLMGFDENDYQALIDNNFLYKSNQCFFTRDKFYKMIGNSIVVNVLEEVFKQVDEIRNLFCR